MTTPSDPGEPGQPGQRQPFEPMPAAPSLNEQELAGVTPAERPKSVDNAFMLWMIGAGLSLLSLIVSFTIGGDAIKDAARDSLRQSQGREPSQQDVDNLANASLIIGVIIGLLFIGLFVLFAYKMRAGRNWARITLTVLGGLSIVLTLIGVGGAGAIDLIVRLVQALLIVGAVYYMFRPDANNYFNAGRVRR
jgi:hypothetical protein